MPDKERFYSSFTRKNISQKKYEHALNIWKKFKITKVELITDDKTYYRSWHVYILWIRCRGKISDISSEYSKANNKYLRSYDPKQESKHIIYLDANDLYSRTMSKFLPTSRFEWIDL